MDAVPVMETGRRNSLFPAQLSKGWKKTVPYWKRLRASDSESEKKSVPICGTERQSSGRRRLEGRASVQESLDKVSEA